MALSLTLPSSNLKLPIIVAVAVAVKAYELIRSFSARPVRLLHILLQLFKIVRPNNDVKGPQTRIELKMDFGFLLKDHDFHIYSRNVWKAP